MRVILDARNTLANADEAELKFERLATICSYKNVMRVILDARDTLANADEART